MQFHVTIHKNLISNNIAVYDDDQLIHQGRRKVDHDFARRVHDELISRGYNPCVYGDVTTYRI